MMIALLLLSVAALASLIVLAMFAYGAWIAHNLTLQERMPVSGHPMQLGLHWEDVAFPSRGDAVPLVGWYLPAPGDNRCIIVIQGTDQHRSDPAIRALELGRDLVDRRFSVLLFDLKAQGESGGNRSSEGDRERWDLVEAIDYVEARGVPVERIGLLGFPLGAGVAILVAAQEPRIPAIVSDSGFMDYVSDIRLIHTNAWGFYLPSWFSFFILWTGRTLYRTDFRRLRPVEVIDQIAQPIYFIHGREDVVISVDETVGLHQASNNPEDRLWLVPGLNTSTSTREIAQPMSAGLQPSLRNTSPEIESGRVRRRRIVRISE